MPLHAIDPHEDSSKYSQMKETHMRVSKSQNVPFSSLKEFSKYTLCCLFSGKKLTKALYCTAI